MNRILGRKIFLATIVGMALVVARLDRGGGACLVNLPDLSRADESADIATEDLVRRVTERDFSNEVLDASVPVLVEFYAPWCGPCRALAPAVESVARDFVGSVKVVKANVDETPELVRRFSITVVPTFMIFREGRPSDTMAGTVAAGELRKRLAALTTPAKVAVVAP